ncbi:hypothetical protein EATA6166_23310 [Enterobacter asburiae]|uniref:Uncharacterized protein n=1 Tax=Enterobacter asburiae TaxID=61645 RepID=A0A8I1G0G5_ENTAS|nr:hypothetical protein [Enterobacter asburiae]MBJ6594471.1 hypothetical protein [Enterobacter asburiae]BEK74439.1 hypothetical protein EATA6166_23310 [Enterobacter asburiae]HEB5886213.1 hypothetical protein [Enterobacter asburiae]
MRTNMESEEIWHLMGIVSLAWLLMDSECVFSSAAIVTLIISQWLLMDSECVFSSAAIVTLIISQCVAYRFALLI